MREELHCADAAGRRCETEKWTRGENERLSGERIYTEDNGVHAENVSQWQVKVAELIGADCVDVC